MQNFKTLLPPNSTEQEESLEIVMSHVGDQPIDIRTVKNPDLCPVELLPWLAWEYAVSYWDDSWSEDQKRSVIENAASVNKHRGTTGAVKQALASIGIPIDLIEWFSEKPLAAAYTFRVVVHANNIDEATITRIIEQINDAKNARSLLSSIDVNPQKIAGTLYISGAVVTTAYAEIGVQTA